MPDWTTSLLEESNLYVLQRASFVYVVAAQKFSKFPAFCGVLTFMNFSKLRPTRSYARPH